MPQKTIYNKPSPLIEMEIKDKVGELEKTTTFKNWRKEHSDYFLTHVFKMLDKENEDSWQVGYCNPDTDAIQTFNINPEGTELMEESEPFKKPGTRVKELNLENVDIDHTKALETARKMQIDKYSKDLPTKTFFILQNIDKDTVYNITFFTASFKTLNIRVSSTTGKVVKDELNSFFSFSK